MPTRTCERCTLTLPERHVRDGLCAECAFAWELTEEPATATAGSGRSWCDSCGEETVNLSLCVRCDPFVKDPWGAL